MNAMRQDERWPLWRYGLLGLPLAFVSLPLYVTLPHHYAQLHGVPLAALGAVLLGTRLLDAGLDPWIGRGIDRLLGRGWRPMGLTVAVGAAVMAAGFALLWVPPVAINTLGWLALWLMVTYLAFSVVSVAHQAWGARLGGASVTRARVVAWREGFALVGVVLASLLPAWGGPMAASAVLALALAAGVLAWRPFARQQDGALRVAGGTADGAAGAQGAAGGPPSAPAAASPWQRPAFRALLAVFLLNGVASAVAATLLPFFVADRLQAASWQPLFLALYFVCAAAALPLWVRLVARIGLQRAWLLGMGLAVVAFVWVPGLVSGDVAAFALICAVSGLALGADLALPGALLAGVVRASGDGGRGEGRYFGWWACATKLNLAAAAGLALPMLAWAGYASGARDEAGLQALAWIYGALPCALKLLAAGALWRAGRHHAVLGPQSDPSRARAPAPRDPDPSIGAARP